MDWISLRGPVGHRRDGTTHVLDTRPEPLTSRERPAVAARRQDSHAFSFTALVNAASLVDQVAGLVAMQHQDAWVAMGVRRADEGLLVEVTGCAQGRTSMLAATRVAGDVRLRIDSDGRRYCFSTQELGNPWVVQTVVDHVVLSTERAGGFVGVILGMTAQGPPGAEPVRFSDVDYVRRALPDIAEPVSQGRGARVSAVRVGSRSG